MRSDEFAYDGTIEGYLTVVGYCITNKIMPTKIVREHDAGIDIDFHEYVRPRPDYRVADAVYRLIGRRSSPEVQQMVNDIFLTSIPEMEIELFILICKAIKYGAVIAEDYEDPFIRRMQFAIRDLYREAQSTLNQLRMNKKGDLSYAMINPRNNVLPIITPGISKDPELDDILIYDKRHRLVFIRIRDREATVDTNRIPYKELRSNEDVYNSLWPYFADSDNFSINIGKKAKADSLTRLWYIAG